MGETKLQLLHAAFEKLRIVDDRITGSDLSPVLPGLLEGDLPAGSSKAAEDHSPDLADELGISASAAEDGGQTSAALKIESDRRMPNGRREGRLPSEAKNRDPIKQGHGSNVESLAPPARQNTNRIPVIEGPTIALATPGTRRKCGSP